MARWQYPSRVDVLTTAGETITQDKWAPQIPDQRRRTIFPLAIFAVSLFFTDPSGAQADASRKVEGWHGQISQPYFSKDRKPHLAPSFLSDVSQPVPRLESWHPGIETPPNRFFATPYLYPYLSIDPFQLTQAERVSFDKWHSNLSEPIRQLAKNQYLYEAFFNDQFFGFQSVEVVTVDKWFVPASEPIQSKRRLQEYPYFAIDPFQLTQIERTTPDKWHPIIQEPRWDLKRHQYLYPPFFNDQFQGFQAEAEVITLDKWFFPLSEPSRFKARLSEYPYFVIDPFQLTRPEATTADRWHPTTNQPLFVKLRTPHRYPSFFTDYRQPVPPIDTWHPGIEIPPKGRFARPPLYPCWILDSQQLTSAERVSLDRWHPAINEPRRDLVRNQYLYEWFFNDQFQGFQISEIVTVDKWHPAIERPPKSRLSKPGLYPYWIVDPFQLTQIERTTLDKWHPAPNQPYRVAFRVPFFVAFSGDFSVAFTGVRIFLEPMSVQSHQISKEFTNHFQQLNLDAQNYLRIAIRIKEIG